MQTIQHHSNPRLCPNHWCWRSWSSPVLWRPTTSSRTNTKKGSFLFFLRDTLNNRQVWPWSSKGSSAVLSHFCCVWLFVTPWTVACQASLSMEFSTQEYWSWLPFPSPRDLPDPEMEPKSLMSPALAGRFFITSAIWEVTKWSRAKAKRVLSREHTGHSKHPFQQPKRWLYTWTSPDDQY